MFNKKIVNWIPKDIQGKIAVNNQIAPEEIEQTPSKKFDKENDDLINLALAKKEDIDNNLAYALQAYEEKLKDINITYNPKEYPLLEESIKCQFCGNPKAASAITLDTIKQKEKFQEKINSSFENSLGVNEDSVLKIGARQQIDFAALIAAQSLQIMWTVIGYALEYVKVILMPTQTVPGLQALVIIADQLIKQMRASLEGDKKKAQAIQDEATNISAYKGNWATVPVANNSFSNISLNCINHQKYYEQSKNTLMPLQKESVNYNNREMVKAAQQTSKQMNVITDLTVPDNYLYTNSKGESKVYRNSDTGFGKSVKQIGLNAKDIFTGDNGFLALLSRFDNMLNDSILTGLKTWWEDPNTFCCVVVNLLKMGKQSTEFLALARVLLEMYKLYLNSDFRNFLINTNDFIYNLGNKIMSEVMKALSSIASTALNNMEINLKKFKVGNEYCAPLNILMDYLYGALGEFKNDLFSMIGSFINSWSSVVDEVEIIAKRNKKVGEVDFFIYLIEMILSFLQSVDKCNDNYKKNYKENKSDEMTTSVNDKLNYPTYTSGSTTNSESVSNVGSLSGLVGGDTSESKSGISNEMVKSFLSNQLGMSTEKTNEIVSSRDNCQCDNVLTDEDIEQIKKIAIAK